MTVAMTEQHSALTRTYNERASHPSTNALAAYLLRLISIKKTNLCLSADVDTSAELLQLADEVGDKICILKTHCDIVNDWSGRTAQSLRDLARKKHFLIFEDRKFADIGGTVQKQYTSGYHRIAQWAEITNAHVLPGPAIVTALEEAAKKTIEKYNTTVHTEISAEPKSIGEVESDDEDAVESVADEVEGVRNGLGTPRGPDRKSSVVSITTSIFHRTESISPRPTNDFHPDDAFTIDQASLLVRLGEPPFLRSLLLLAEMSSEGHLLTDSYREACVSIARKNREFVMGFIAQRSLNSQPDDNFITMTPGVQLPPPGQEGKKLGDNLGQQYNSPRNVIFGKGCDVIIVGRGIINAKDRKAEAERYRIEGWKAYEDRVRRRSSV